jgi:hypothetical protein
VTPLRPLFTDGAILGAADLTTLSTLDRDRDARHGRHLHTPGVAVGLELTSADNQTAAGAAFLDVTLTPGFAIDGTGRELVAAEALPVSADRFLGEIPNPVKQPGSDITVWYPVFVHGLDAEVAATNGQLGCQAATGPTRVAEDVEVEFGRPGDASVEQPVPAPDAGPGDGSWRVLVGFVQLDTSIGKFVEIAAEADGVRVPGAGARAGLVAGQTGRVEVRAVPATTAGVPAVVLDDDEGGSLVFGLHNGTGSIAPLMTVDASGNLVVTGTLKGVQTAGAVLVASGVAFDGVVLPLPTGADPDAIASGGLTLSVLLTPRHPAPDSAPSPGQRFVPAECRIDDDRRVHCWGTWFPPGATGTPQDVSSACDYIVLVSVEQGGA